MLHYSCRSSSLPSHIIGKMGEGQNGCLPSTYLPCELYQKLLFSHVTTLYLTAREAKKDSPVAEYVASSLPHQKMDHHSVLIEHRLWNQSYVQVPILLLTSCEIVSQIF